MKFKLNDRVKLTCESAVTGGDNKTTIQPGEEGTIVDIRGGEYGADLRVYFDGHMYNIWLDKSMIAHVKTSKKKKPVKNPKAFKEPPACPTCGKATAITPFRSIAWPDAPPFYRMACKCGWHGPSRRSKQECLYRDYMLSKPTEHGPFTTKSKTGPTGLQMVEKIIEYHQPRLPAGHKCAHCTVRLAEASQKPKGASQATAKPDAMPWSKLSANGWLIVGMNHYSLHGATHLYVAMMKQGKCMVAQGTDELTVFEDLENQAGIKSCSNNG